MSWMKHKSFAIVAGTLAAAALLGASLGVVAAGSKPPLASGFNLVGGPLGGDVPPADFVGCLPAGSWTSIYIWDGPTQQWQHFFAGVPAYVNAPANNGVATIKRFAGVVLIMNQAVGSPRLKDQASETCS
ncbi:MAG: hypothetical protein HYX53_14470 [Chloroflexi bacterium]|nr:hypothetical protein [Chloroflexota bacterium]